MGRVFQSTRLPRCLGPEFLWLTLEERHILTDHLSTSVNGGLSPQTVKFIHQLAGFHVGAIAMMIESFSTADFERYNRTFSELDPIYLGREKIQLRWLHSSEFRRKVSDSAFSPQRWSLNEAEKQLVRHCGEQWRLSRSLTPFCIAPSQEEILWPLCRDHILCAASKELAITATFPFPMAADISLPLCASLEVQTRAPPEDKSLQEIAQLAVRPVNVIKKNQGFIAEVNDER